MGRGVYEKISFTGNPKAVTYEKEPVTPTPIVKDYSPSEKKVEPRTTEQILASMEMTVCNAQYKNNNMGTLSPEQQIELLMEKTKHMTAANKAEAMINNPAYTATAIEANTKYAITDTSITVSENVWYKILHPNTEGQYHISYQNGKCYIVTHLSNIKMLALTQTSLMGLYGTAVEEHMSKSRFDSVVTNGPTVKTLSTIYKICDIQRANDMPKDELFWKNPIPVFNHVD